ncbi:MAG: hypothetical protein OXE95_08630 [Chloroflexi bacterium]|nr:hypothetical protein [Chloroflexota bacterium]MCY4247624.1 hypothetical protein [Chloroflexota bacterium]
MIIALPAIGVLAQQVAHMLDLEAKLHKRFDSKRKEHPIKHSGSTEWLALTAVQVAHACSH